MAWVRMLEPSRNGAGILSGHCDMPFDSDARASPIVLLVPDIADPITHNRAESFAEAGHSVSIMGFRRNRFRREDPPGGPHVTLGDTSDARYLQRFRALLGALPHLAANYTTLRKAEAIYARNVDQLALALLVRHVLLARAEIIYEVLDIQPLQVGRGPIARALRLIERICLRHVRLLVVSSPAFHANYFERVQRYRGRWFLLENKLPTSIAAGATRRRQAVARAERRSDRWVIGYFGLIRGQATIDLIVRLAQQLRDVAEFRFAGIVTSVDPDSFRRAVEENENIGYEGEYAKPADLARLYGGVDLAWAVDLENVDANSRWLMPCRFYEAGYFGVPCVSASGFEISRIIEDLGCGWTVDAPYETALVRFLRNLTIERYVEKQHRLAALPDSTFVASIGADGLSRILR